MINTTEPVETNKRRGSIVGFAMFFAIVALAVIGWFLFSEAMRGACGDIW
jgi:hypothetical protein